MAASPESVQINAEEFDKDEKKLAGKLAGTLNNWLLTVSELFNKKFTFSENFSGDAPVVRVTGGQPITFRYGGPGRPRFLLIGQFTNVTNPSEILANPVSLPQWSYDGRGSITIQPIPGFTVLNKYDIVLSITTG